MAGRLDVFLGEKCVGTLTRTRKGARFSYLQEIVDEYPGVPVLSMSLPVKSRPYGEGLTRAWFSGLLPEGERLERVCREIGCSTADYFGVLSAIGSECAGATSILAPESFGSQMRTDDTILGESELTLRLNEEADSIRASAGAIVRVSLGGFQGKLCVIIGRSSERGGHLHINEAWLPDAHSISSHILKPQPSHRHAGLVCGEAWAMRLAGCAARCARTWLLDLDGAPQTLVVERFDRMRECGTLKRIHQEDLCQALGLDPADKYAHARVPKGTDPTYAKAANLLVVYAEDSEAELKELLRQLVVTLAVGNTDAHGKNLSFIFETPGVPTLSPLYDVVPVVDVDPRADTLSMRVNGKIRLCDIVREDVVDEAVAWGLNRKTVFSVIDDALEGLRQGLCEAGKLYPEAISRHEAPTLERMGCLCAR